MGRRGRGGGMQALLLILLPVLQTLHAKTPKVAEANDFNKVDWENGPQMLSERDNIAAVAVGEGGLVVVGGSMPRENHWDHLHGSTFVEHLTEKEFVNVTRLRVPRYGCTVQEHNGYVYVIGGALNRTEFWGSMEVLNVKELKQEADPHPDADHPSEAEVLKQEEGHATSMRDEALLTDGVNALSKARVVGVEALATEEAKELEEVLEGRGQALGSGQVDPGTTVGTGTGATEEEEAEKKDVEEEEEETRTAKIEESGQWTPEPALPSPRAFMGSVLIGDKIYVFGGLGPENQAYSDWWVFDTQHRKWTADHDTMAPAAQGRAKFGMAAYEGHIFIFGGVLDHNSEDEVGDVIAFNLETGWLPKPISYIPGGAHRAGMAVVTAGKFAYLIGGTGPDGLTPTARVDVFDMEKHVWHRASDLAVARSAHAAAMVGDKLYAIGGWGPAGEEGGARRDSETLAMDPKVDEPLGSPDAESPSHWWEWVLILFVALLVYLGVGCLFNKYTQDKEGWEMLPNHAFWRSAFEAIKEKGEEAWVWLGYRWSLFRNKAGYQGLRGDQEDFDDTEQPTYPEQNPNSARSYGSVEE